VHHAPAQRRVGLRRLPDHSDGLRPELGANAERVRDWIAAFNERDFDALFTDAGEDTEWATAREHPAATVHRGAEAARSYLEDWLRTIPDMRLEADELMESGDLVLMVGRAHGAGAGSGETTDVPLCTVTTFEQGRGVRVEEFLDEARARAEFERRTAAPE
jgi:ketosteroid isomerase-like protein